MVVVVEERGVVGLGVVVVVVVVVVVLVIVGFSVVVVVVGFGVVVVVDVVLEIESTFCRRFKPLVRPRSSCKRAMFF